MEAKVLVVDDEVRTLRLMEAMLVPAGYEVILAENGTEAISKAIMTSPDVILLDVMMPGMDGFEVASKLRANRQTKDIPIVTSVKGNKSQAAEILGISRARLRRILEGGETTG